MEQPSLPAFLWVMEPPPECLACGGALYAEEADLTLIGPESVTYALELGHCDSCGRWYGFFGDLEELLTEQDWAEGDVQEFLIDEEPLGAGVGLGQEFNVAPWVVFQEQISRLREADAAPPPEPEAVRALDVLAETWEVGQRPAAWIGEPPDDVEPAYLALVIDGQGLIRGNSLQTGAPHSAEDLAELILRAIAAPAVPDAPRGRPREVRLDDAARAEVLARGLEDAGITVRAAPVERVEAVLEEAAAGVGGVAPAPYFIAYDEEEVRAYFEAAHAFYEAKPWQRLEGHKYMAFRIGDGPWRYLNVMGQMEEEPGLSVFDDWLQLCRFLHNTPTLFETMTDAGNLKPVRAAGAVEGLTLAPLPFLHPRDGVYLRGLGVTPLPEGYPAVHRHTGEHSEHPSLPLPAYRALMTAVRTAVEKRRATPVTSIKETFETGGLTIALRYPSRGKEGVPAEAGAFRIVTHGTETDFANNPLPPGAHLEVDVPGEATLEAVARAVRQETNDHVWPSAIGSGDFACWSDDSMYGTPSPRAFQLAGLASLWMEMAFENRYPMEVKPHSEMEPLDEIRVVERS